MEVCKDVLSQLNEYQKLAVINDSPACLVNANVGSGKTTVLISKIFYLHKEKGIPFCNMVVLTFTNKASNEIKERMIAFDSSIGDEDMPYFGTFHSVALKMLKTILPLSELEFTQNFTVIDPDEEVDMATSIILDNSLEIKYINKLSKRLELMNQGQAEYAKMKYADDIRHLVRLLQTLKAKENKMNFSDLIANATYLLNRCDYRPKWIIIDEFQDSDESQLQFIKTLLGSDTKVFAVGDPNQIIYSWRGSNQNVFNKFKTEYSASELTLPINYRSCSTILEVAKCFLSNPTVLNGLREQGSKIIIKNHYNSFNEAEYLSNKILQLIQKGIEYNDIAIFYRLQRQSKTLEDVFSRNGIPFEVSMKKTLKDIPVLGWFIRLLRFSVNINDTGSATYVLTHNLFGKQLSKAEVKSILKGKETYKSNMYAKMVGFKNWCRTAQSIIDAYTYFLIDDYINPTSVSFAENKKLVIALLEKIDSYVKLRKVGIWDSVLDFINSSALYGISILNDDVHLGSNTVKLMTLHASKGLEFKYVFIIGANLGLIPLMTKSIKEQDEETRLFFVGITRAKDFLEISYCTSPDDQRVTSGASSYISMIPHHLIEREEIITEEGDLQSYRREIIESKEKILQCNTKKIDDNKKARHSKYGIGIVKHEDVDTITILFEGYGEKEFLKAFCEIEYLL